MFACVSTISVSRSPASICHCQTHQSQCSQSPPTLKCRRIHSLSLFFSIAKNVTRGPLKSRNCTRKRLAARAPTGPAGWGSLSTHPDSIAAIWGLLLIGGEGREEEGTGRGGVEGTGREGERENEGEWRERGAPTFLFKFTPLYTAEFRQRG